jgi:hypothetical protein
VCTSRGQAIAKHSRNIDRFSKISIDVPAQALNIIAHQTHG